MAARRAQIRRWIAACFCSLPMDGAAHRSSRVASVVFGARVLGARAFGVCLLGACLVSGCAGPPHIVPLLSARTPDAAPIDAPLEVVSRGVAVADPLPVRGSDVVYGDLEAALGEAVTSAVAPWAAEHRADPTAREGGWSLLVELTKADAELERGGRLVVGLDVRATLRTRRGNVYVAQTQAGCREGGLVSADAGAAVAARCMQRVGSDLAGWLSGTAQATADPAAAVVPAL